MTGARAESGSRRTASPTWWPCPSSSGTLRCWWWTPRDEEIDTDLKRREMPFREFAICVARVPPRGNASSAGAERPRAEALRRRRLRPRLLRVPRVRHAPTRAGRLAQQLLVERRRRAGSSSRSCGDHDEGLGTGRANENENEKEKDEDDPNSGTTSECDRSCTAAFRHVDARSHRRRALVFVVRQRVRPQKVADGPARRSDRGTGGFELPVPDVRARARGRPATKTDAARGAPTKDQPAGALLFVPSCRAHQVHNETDCLSINHGRLNDPRLRRVGGVPSARVADASRRASRSAPRGRRAVPTAPGAQGGDQPTAARGARGVWAPAFSTRTRRYRIVESRRGESSKELKEPRAKERRLANVFEPLRHLVHETHFFATRDVCEREYGERHHGPKFEEGLEAGTRAGTRGVGERVDVARAVPSRESALEEPEKTPDAFGRVRGVVRRRPLGGKRPPTRGDRGHPEARSRRGGPARPRRRATRLVVASRTVARVYVPNTCISEL